MHALLAHKGQMFDLGKAGAGRPNSAAFGVNNLGQVAAQADTIIKNAEDFCGFNAYGFPSSTACLPFLWQYGILQALPTLGGANAWQTRSTIADRPPVGGNLDPRPRLRRVPIQARGSGKRRDTRTPDAGWRYLGSCSRNQ